MTYNNGSAYTFTWTQGRRLATAVKGSNSLSFTYNSDGVRTSKTVNGTKHTYVVNGTNVYSDTWIVGYTTHIVVYVYDENGSPVGMIYRNSTMAQDSFEYYIFAKNPQGDITAVYSASGTLLVQYRYDAWGNVTTTYYNGGASTAVQYNSFRYRGYFYDSELNLYYLNSRYYDPATGRFLNADVYINANGDLTGFNMFAYCSNNPVAFVDKDGYSVTSPYFMKVAKDYKADLALEYYSLQAYRLANNATYKVENDKKGNITVSITVYLTDDYMNFPKNFEWLLIDQLYKNSVIVLENKGVNPKEANLMSIEHIEWEYNVHKAGMAIPFLQENCYKTDLNVDENWFEIAKRAIKAIFK